MDHSNFYPPNSVDATSSQLLQRIVTHDPDAWQQFVILYGPVVRYWIRRAGLDSTDLADVFQDVFLAVARTIGNFERQSGAAKFRAWLKTITSSKVNDHFRRQGKQPAGRGGTTALKLLNQVQGSELDHQTEEGDDPALAHSEDSFLTHRTLQIVKQEFREQTWKAFYRTAIDKCTSREVADELGMTALAVRKAKSRVLQRLKDALRSSLSDDSPQE